MLNKAITIASVLIAIVSLSLWASEKHSGHSTRLTHNPPRDHSESLVQGGQATSAALVEIVARLEEDSNTDWSRVNIDSLHSHLVDMHQVMINTQATSTMVDDRTIRYDIRGSAAAVPSLHRMVTAHSRFIEQSRDWNISSELTDGGASLTIKVSDSDATMRLAALGFFGFMSLDSHHQDHHFQLAMGHSH